MTKVLEECDKIEQEAERIRQAVRESDGGAIEGFTFARIREDIAQRIRKAAAEDAK